MPKVIANPPVEAGPGGAWVLPFWRESALLPRTAACAPGRGLHSSTLQLNVSAFCGLGG